MATVHIFHLHRFEPIVRPALLTAFLGYVLVVVGLVFDLGRPWRIWHAIVIWNPHSVMFEVAWCVMLYTTVLASSSYRSCSSASESRRPCRCCRRDPLPW